MSLSIEKWWPGRHSKCLSPGYLSGIYSVPREQPERTADEGTNEDLSRHTLISSPQQPKGQGTSASRADADLSEKLSCLKSLCVGRDGSGGGNNSWPDLELVNYDISPVVGCEV